MLALGYTGALLIGLVLGLLGGGGSILTVPILVYLLKIDPVTATAYSLFIVGVSALFGAVRNAQKGMINYKTGVIFAIPTIISVFLTRKVIVPAIPDVLLETDSFSITKNFGIMVLFAIVMLFASYSMIKTRKNRESTETKNINILTLSMLGLVIGVIAGLVGAGGGFLIIPALVIIAKLQMKEAVATSLMIIAVQSLIGFTGSIGNVTIDWSFLIIFSGISVAGIFIGIYLNRFIEGPKLKKGFGWFVLVMGVYILLRETLFNP